MASDNYSKPDPGRLFQRTLQGDADQPSTHPQALEPGTQQDEPLFDKSGIQVEEMGEGPSTIPTLQSEDLRDSRDSRLSESREPDSGMAPPSTSILMACEQQRLVFNGTGSEYFRIWIVNLTLTIITLGVYSAWAKVRRLQYFYHATSLEGVCFDYSAKPINILGGRVIALSLFGVYYLAYNFLPQLGALVGVIILLVLPYLLRQSHRFKARNTLHRGIAFHFDGSVAAAYQAYLPPLLVLFAPSILASLVVSERGGLWVIALSLIGLLALPFFHAVFRRFMQRNLRYGDAGFGFGASNRDFFAVWLKGMGVSFLMGLVFVIVLAIAGLIAALVMGKTAQGGQASLIGGLLGVALGYFLAYVCIGSYYAARFQKLVWEHTVLGEISFKCNLSALKLFKRQVINTILIILTLGLYRPFAAVNIAKLRLESMSIVGTERLDEFFAAPDKGRGGAVGEGTAELFDMDVSF